MNCWTRNALIFAAVLAAEAAGAEKVYLICEKAGAAPVAALAEAKPGGEVAVLAVREGAPGACREPSVHEVRGVPEPDKPQAARGNTGQREAGHAVAGGAARLGGANAGAGAVSSRISRALAQPGGVPELDFSSAQLSPAMREVIQTVLKTKHDTVKNSISNIR